MLFNEREAKYLAFLGIRGHRQRGQSSPEMCFSVIWSALAGGAEL
jgi:hypothetical protein